MDAPVFVLHGVAHRDPDGFAELVASLQAAAGVPMIPVHWGDLGADERFVTAALPLQATVPAAREEESDSRGTRAAASSPTGRTGHGDRDDDLFGVAVSALAPPRADVRLAELADVVRVQLASVHSEAHLADEGLREGPGGAGPDPREVIEELTEAWPHTRWLSRTDDPALLEEAGRAVAEAVWESTRRDDGDLHDGLRGDGDREPGHVRSVVRRQLDALDRVAGAAVQAVAGRVNHTLRTRFGPGTARFLGDVLVYQRHRATVHERIRQVVDGVDPGLGRSPEKPVRIVAHSLGGVIAVDMATAATPLWTERLVTFGSQAAFFHACDPRGGQLTPYLGQGPVVLPRSLARWTNLWEPLDPLAFVAAGVFQLYDGNAPVDVAIPHRASTGLWTHSAYWDLPVVASAISAAMAPA